MIKVRNRFYISVPKKGYQYLSPLILSPGILREEKAESATVPGRGWLTQKRAEVI